MKYNGNVTVEEILEGRSSLLLCAHARTGHHIKALRVRLDLQAQTQDFVVYKGDFEYSVCDNLSDAVAIYNGLNTVKA